MKLLIAFGAKTSVPNKDKYLPVDLAEKTSRASRSLQLAPNVKVVELLRELAPLATTPLGRSGRLRETNGDRMLFLDGGGMRSLVEIEILMEIERRTGRRITEMFDWIVGTSVG